MIVRFIGTVAEIYGVADFKYFGQSADIPDQIYRDAILGNCALLPEADFNAMGFTEQELKAYANPGPRHSASREFKAKFDIARVKLYDIRDALENPKSSTPKAVPTPTPGK